MLLKKLEHATGIDISSLATKSDVIALNAEVNKLDRNKLVNEVLTGLNILVNKSRWFRCCWVGNCSCINGKKSDVVTKEIVKKRQCIAN